MNEFESACARAEEGGHRLEDAAPRLRLTTMRRQTCTGCQRSVIGNERVAYGSATETACPVSMKKTE